MDPERIERFPKWYQAYEIQWSHVCDGLDRLDDSSVPAEQKADVLKDILIRACELPPGFHHTDQQDHVVPINPPEDDWTLQTDIRYFFPVVSGRRKPKVLKLVALDLN